MERSLSSIIDEVNRNSVKGKYDPKKAQHKAYVKRKYAKYQGKKIVENKELREFVEKELMDDQSPAAIAERINKHEKHLPSISKDSVYRFLKSPYGKVIVGLRQKKKRYSCGHHTKKVKLSDRVFIDKRPQYINNRKRRGDAEADFIVSGKSGKGILLVVVDRKTRKAFLSLILVVTIRNVHAAFLRIKKRFPELKTVTTDNDILFRYHKILEKLLNIKIYFCHPYHSWEKGGVENTNKIIRRDIPKGSDLSKYSPRFIRRLEEKLNRRFMKCINSLTPNEAFELEKKRKQRQCAVKKS